MDTITLNRKQFVELMNEAAQVALNLEKMVRNTIKAEPETDTGTLIRKSIAGIAGDVMASKAFNGAN